MTTLDIRAVKKKAPRRRRPKPFVILSIDGGGLRGLLPLYALKSLSQFLEDRGDNRRFHEHFDIIAGTSTGGIIAAGLCCPEGPLAPWSAFTIPKLIDLYERNGEEIFNSRPAEPEALGWMSRILGIVSGYEHAIHQPKHDDYPLMILLRETLGKIRISQALTKIVLTAFDIDKMEPVFITNIEVGPYSIKGPDHHDYLFAEAARATAAAPSFLSPAKVQLNSRTQMLVDGGVFANNPTLVAYMHAKQLGVADNDIYILSLGTGTHFQRTKYSKSTKWGMLDWVDPRKDIPILAVLLDAPAKSVANLLGKSLDDANYVRIDFNFSDLPGMDDASVENLENIKIAAAKMLESKQVVRDLKRFASVLTSR